MIYTFKDTDDGLCFQFYDNLPENKGQYKFSALNKINLCALTLFGMYRKTIYDSYSTNPDLAQDIKSFNQNPVHIENHRVVDQTDPLNNYATYGALLGVNKMQAEAKCYIAYKKNDQGWPEKVGFISFYPGQVTGRPVIYISDAGVKCRGASIGRRLMECVLTHFPEGTEFYILTRQFNKEAISLYHDRLGFEPISQDEINQLDYDERYVGFKHVSTKVELDLMKDKRIDDSSPERIKIKMKQ